MWLIVRQSPMKAGWWDVPLVLLFSALRHLNTYRNSQQEVLANRRCCMNILCRKLSRLTGKHLRLCLMIKIGDLFRNLFTKDSEAKKNNTLVFGNAGDKKKSSPLRPHIFFFNLVEFSKESLHLKNYSSNTFLCWKTKSLIFYCLKGKNVDSYE